MTTVRNVKTVVNGSKAFDGDGVKLTRIIGTPLLNMLDPFLLLDFFGTDEPQDYIGGFPSHPHRGFETVTYMLEGKMRHKDSAGNEGVIESGGIQWMTAGKGIIHSEMPEQTEGLLSGFQLWINLPAKDKMTAPKYQESTADEISVETLENGSTIKVIAGKTIKGTTGVISNDYIDPSYWDINLLGSDSVNESIAAGHNGFVYVIEGSIVIGNSSPISKGQLAVLDEGDALQINNSSDADESRFIVVAGRPLGEPVARGGPFVMNTREQIEQAFDDYRRGNLI